MGTDLNEGVWDSLKNKASMVGNAFKAAGGSSTADGKLRIQKVATTLYSGYKKFLGSSTGRADTNTMKKFMKQETVLTSNFIDHWATEFGEYLNMEPSDRKKFQNTYDYSGDDHLTVSTSKGNAKDEVDDSDYQTTEVVYDAVSLSNPNVWSSEEFLGIPAPKFPPVVTKHFNSTKWKAMTVADGVYEPSLSPDGSIVYAKNEGDARVIKALMDKHINAGDLLDKLYDAGLLTDIGGLEKKNSWYTDSRENLIRDSLMTAAYYIGRNRNKFIDRLVCMSPKIAMAYKEINSGGLGAIDILNTETNTLMEDERAPISDQELRDYFMMVAKSAFLSGYLPSNGIAESIAESISSEAMELIDGIVEDATTTSSDIAVNPSYLGSVKRPRVLNTDNKLKE